MAKARGDRCRCIGKRGLVVSLARSRPSDPFFGGSGPSDFWRCYMRRLRVWFVEVEGNSTIPDRKILSAAEACGVKFWAKSGRNPK